MSCARYLTAQVEKDLSKKMVFLSGPRQVGKTTLAKQLEGGKQGYLNWDVVEDRERILRRELPPGSFWIFDEIHKYRPWRNYLKGLYDSRPVGQRILVTGSGRLDLYRFGGDSLQGRYHLLRLHPFTLAELPRGSKSDMSALLELGGFPEPLFGGSAIEARRWSREYRNRLVREDVMSLERVQDLGKLELLMLRLPALVGSPLSINALREDLQVSHKTVAGWLEVLERLYGIFRLSPFGAPKIRAVKKEQKHYQFDWTLVSEPGPRFENLVACHLLKWTHWLQDVEGRDVELRYFRDTDGREVDFVIVEDGAPTHLIECKVSDSDVHRPLRYLNERFPKAKSWQLHAAHRDFQTPDGIRVCPAEVLLRQLV